MATVIRPELSVKNKYYIHKHRHYELKHFCLQYPSWKKECVELEIPSIASSAAERMPSSNIPGDPTSKLAVRRAYYSERIKLIERITKEADEFLHEYILRGVTEGLSFTYLKSKLGIPCSRDTYYDRYRRFFWLLSEARK